jgi:predicted nucleic-acid-binding protein
MATTIKRKINYTKVILVTLAVIGTITILDNTYRLTKEIGNSVIKTVQSHKWSTRIIK